MINYILLSVSMFSIVLQNGLFNTVSKKKFKTRFDTFHYNAWLDLICFLLFAVLAIGSKISVYSVVLGLIFGIVTMFSNFFKMTALSKGPMHITILITTASMIIPAMSGAIMFGESFSIGKALAIMLLIFFIYISLKKDKGAQLNKQWILYCALAFVFQGTIGIIQKIHQTSAHKEELLVFLAAAFVFSFIFSLFMAKGGKTKLNFSKREYIFAAICGVCTFLMNYINLKLSGILPTQLFFPLVNGGAIILTSIVSVVIFKEKIDAIKLRVKQEFSSFEQEVLNLFLQGYSYAEIAKKLN